MNKQYNKREAPLPSIEEIQNELKKGENLDDFSVEKEDLPGYLPAQSKRCWKEN